MGTMCTEDQVISRELCRSQNNQTPRFSFLSIPEWLDVGVESRLVTSGVDMAEVWGGEQANAGNLGALC